MISLRFIKFRSSIFGVEIDGFLGDVWRELERSLGFEYTTSVSESWGAYPYPNGSWGAGIMGLVIGDQVDVSLNEFAFTNTRKTYVDYSNPVLHVR